MTSYKWGNMNDTPMARDKGGTIVLAGILAAASQVWIVSDVVLKVARDITTDTEVTGKSIVVRDACVMNTMLLY